MWDLLSTNSGLLWVFGQVLLLYFTPQSHELMFVDKHRHITDVVYVYVMRAAPTLSTR